MDRRRAFSIDLLCAIMLLAAFELFQIDSVARAGAQWATNPGWTAFAPPNDVSFTISAARSNYSVHDTITVNYRIANIGKRPLYVPKTWQPTCQTGLHVAAWFENSAGQYSVSGYGFSCSSGPNNRPPTVAERMSKEAVLIEPGGHFDGSMQLNAASSHLTPGAYLIEATLYGWDPGKFNDSERSEFAKLGNPSLRGEVPAAMSIELTP